MWYTSLVLNLSNVLNKPIFVLAPRQCLTVSEIPLISVPRPFVISTDTSLPSGSNRRVIIISCLYRGCVQVREVSAVPYCEGVVYYSGILKASCYYDRSVNVRVSVSSSVE